MRLMLVSRTQASADAMAASKSLAKRRLRPSQAKLGSTDLRPFLPVRNPPVPPVLQRLIGQPHNAHDRSALKADSRIMARLTQHKIPTERRHLARLSRYANTSLFERPKKRRESQTVVFAACQNSGQNLS